MIEVVAKNPDTVTLRVTVRRLAVYLDNWAIVELAKDRIVCSRSVDVEGLRVATVEENSTIPPSLRVVKDFEREAVVIADQGS